MADSDTENDTSPKEEATFVQLDNALSSVEWKDGFPLEVHLLGEITQQSASEFETSFKDAIRSGQEEIVVVIHSEGGCVYSASKIVDLIEMCPVPVHTVCRGSAMSAAAMIFSCGEHRVIGKHASLMIHAASTTVYGKAMDVKIESKELERLTTQMCKVMAENTGQTPEFFQKRMDTNTDLYISPTEALELGLATHIGDIRLNTNISVHTSAEILTYRTKKTKKRKRSA